MTNLEMSNKKKMPDECTTIGIMKMNWQKLKELIQVLDKQEKGKKKGETFEKLVARLFELLLEIPFVSAKSGPQPSGDARNQEGNVTIEAKNYSNNSTLRNVEIVGGIHITKDHLQNLQVYVLVVSRDISAQLLDKLEFIEKNTGLDIVSLVLSDDLSDIGALCATFWEEIRRFFDPSNTDEEFLTWIEEMKNDAETEQKLEELKEKLDSGIQSQYHVKMDIKKYLADRFNRDEGFNRINLSQAIDRQEIETKISDWVGKGRCSYLLSSR